MSLDPGLREQLVRLLSRNDDHGNLGPRLSGDAARLTARLERFLTMNLVSPIVDNSALELACYALQLPHRQKSGEGKPVRAGLRDRCEQSAELLVSHLGEKAEEALLDRCARILHETPQRSPMLDEARLLADALNLDDFGLIGLMNQAMQLSSAGDGLLELIVAANKREQYSYWQARLKDGFHFEPIRKIALHRLEEARKVVARLKGELYEDGAK